MRRPIAARAAVAVRNASPHRRTCGGRCPQCVAPSPHVWRSLSAMRRPVAAGVAVPVRNASPRRRMCGGRCPQCVAPSPHVRRSLSAMRRPVAAGGRLLSAMRRPIAAGAALSVRNGSPRRRMCGGPCRQWVAPSPHVRRVAVRNASPRHRTCVPFVSQHGPAEPAWETHENTKLQRENRPLSRLRHLSPRKRPRGEKDSRLRESQVVQADCEKCGLTSLRPTEPNPARTWPAAVAPSPSSYPRRECPPAWRGRRRRHGRGHRRRRNG